MMHGGPGSRPFFEAHGHPVNCLERVAFLCRKPSPLTTEALGGSSVQSVGQGRLTYFCAQSKTHRRQPATLHGTSKLPFYFRVSRPSEVVSITL